VDHLYSLVGNVDTIIAVLTIVAGTIVGLRDYARRRTQDEAERVLKVEGLPLRLENAAVRQGEAGRMLLDMSFTIGEPVDRPAAGDFPADVTIVAVRSQPFEQHYRSDRQLSQKTSGDENAGFYILPRASGDGYPAGARVEVYRWGRLTAGVLIRLLWLPLLPFSLANAAMWLAPPERARRYFVHLLCRLFALALTVTTVLAIVAAALDLGGWQCLSRDSCSRFSLNAPVAGHLGRTLAVMALIPLAAILFGWYLAVRTWRSYDSYHYPRTATAAPVPAAPDFLAGRHTVRRLRIIHITAALAALDLMLVAPMAKTATRPYATALMATAMALLGLTVVSLAVPWMVEDSERWPTRWLLDGARLAALLLTAATLAWVWQSPDVAVDDLSGLPYLQAAASWVFATQLLLCLLMAASAKRERSRGGLRFNIGVPIFTVLSLGAVAALLAGMVYRAAGLVSKVDVAQPPARGHPLPAAPYQWAGLGFAVMLAIAIVALIIVIQPSRQDRKVATSMMEQDYGPGRVAHPARARKVEQAIATRDIVHRTLAALGWICLPLLVVATWGTVPAIRGDFPAEVLQRSWFADTAIGFGLLGVAVIAALWLIIIVRRRQSFRDAVGFLWEIVTFWPRTCHPLAPPCYAMRTVPEVALRVSEILAAKPQARVILVGRGQGSVHAFAALRHLADEDLRRIGFVTTASPLGKLYPRTFDEHFDAVAYADLATRLTEGDQPPRWFNLWRGTDPLSFPITLHGGRDINARLVDPAGLGFADDKNKPRFAKIYSHQDYQEDGRFAEIISKLARHL
jgi:hypothetical protein